MIMIEGVHREIGKLHLLLDKKKGLFSWVFPSPEFIVLPLPPKKSFILINIFVHRIEDKPPLYVVT